MGDGTMRCGRSERLERTVLPVLWRLRRATRGGARKEIDALVEKIRDLAAGSPIASPRALAPLTPREAEIAELIRDGLTTKEIADLLGVSPLTIEAHRVRIRRRLGLSRKRKNLTTYLREL